MKKLLSVLLVLILLPASVFAAGKTGLIDLENFSDAELYELLDEIKAELTERNKEQLYNSIDEVGFYTAEYSMARYLELDLSSGKSGFSRLNSEYSAHTTGGIRIVTVENRIVKAAANFDLDDSTASVLRMYLLAGILENKLYEKESISASDKRSAFDAAKKIVDSATGTVGSDNLIKVAKSNKEGCSLLATTGRLVYHWEYLDGTIWLSTTLCKLPDGIE